MDALSKVEQSGQTALSFREEPFHFGCVVLVCFHRLSLELFYYRRGLSYSLLCIKSRHVIYIAQRIKIKLQNLITDLWHSDMHLINTTGS